MLRLPVLASLLTLLAQVLVAASPVGVYLEFDAPPSGTTVEAMQKETSRILDRVGIEIAWRWVSQNQGNELFERLAVVKFTGECACGGFLAATRDILVLGTTAVTSGHVLPYSQVRCDAVRRLLPDIEFASDRRAGDRALGRVLGRVLSHELYHAVLGTTHHATFGLAKEFQTTDELRSGALSFNGTDWDLSPAAAK
ncbi:MAG TPA: hypothetical protein VMU80_07370 [Bryobacteraceae bacterium]|nr:hypothetical protein [Bryobacteraceae bacterium]